MKLFFHQFKLTTWLMKVDMTFVFLFVFPAFLLPSIFLLSQLYHPNSWHLLMAFGAAIAAYFAFKYAIVFYNKEKKHRETFDCFSGDILMVPILAIVFATTSTLSIYVFYMFFFDINNL